MRKIREILRLKHDLHLPDREIAQSCNLSRSTIGEYLQRARKATLTWPLPPNLDDEALEGLLFKHAASNTDPGASIDWNTLHAELQRKGVTRLLLWREYKQREPNGVGYTKFTRSYKAWKTQRGLSMRQTHKAGEKLFVDYAGLTVPITDKNTGETLQAQVFVGTLGASNYTYCEVTASQKVDDWLGSHTRMLEFFGGCPRVIVPDNLKSGVKSASYYEPEINRVYTEFATHYGLAVIPARVRKPKDKAKVEVHVQIVERDILAPLRDRTFFSLGEANEAIQALLRVLNTKPFQKLEGCRQSVFETLEKPALQPLPTEAFMVSEWRKAKVNLDYHIEMHGHHYSVPYQLARAVVDVRLTQNLVEVFMAGKRVASHVRAVDFSQNRDRHTTVADHMPKAHQRYGDWSLQRLVNWAGKNGPFTAKVVDSIMERKPHPEQGFRSCLGLMRLSKDFGAERLEAACRRADHIGAYSFKSVQSILQNKLDLETIPQPENRRDVQYVHHNLRGAAYYQRENLALDAEMRIESC